MPSGWRRPHGSSSGAAAASLRDQGGVQEAATRSKGPLSTTTRLSSARGTELSAGGGDMLSGWGAMRPLRDDSYYRLYPIQVGPWELV